MLEFGQKHKRGPKTFMFIYFQKIWLMGLCGLGLLLLAWAIYAGPLNYSTALFLMDHPDWFIDTSMLGQWIALLGISVIFISWLIANVEYRHYKFILDEHAVHLHKGIFFTREITIPYVQITNVHIDRPFYYKMYGVAKLDIVTAADRDIDRHDRRHNKGEKTFLMPVIDLSIARMLATQLLECATRSRKGLHVYGDAYNEEDTEDEESDDSEDYEVSDELDEGEEDADDETDDSDEDTQDTIKESPRTIRNIKIEDADSISDDENFDDELNSGLHKTYRRK